LSKDARATPRLHVALEQRGLETRGLKPNRDCEPAEAAAHDCDAPRV
jgi:hypothetical protein